MPNKPLDTIIPLTGILIILDQWSKWSAQNELTSPWIVIPKILTIKYAENNGIAWSINLPQILLYLIPPILIATAIYITIKHSDYNKKITQITLSLFLAGAIGNYIDRITYGYVIDFISIGWWPIFNLADIYISLTAFLIIGFYGKITR